MILFSWEWRRASGRRLRGAADHIDLRPSPMAERAAVGPEGRVEPRSAVAGIRLMHGGLDVHALADVRFPCEADTAVERINLLSDEARDRSAVCGTTR